MYWLLGPSASEASGCAKLHDKGVLASVTGSRTFRDVSAVEAVEGADPDLLRLRTLPPRQFFVLSMRAAGFAPVEVQRALGVTAKTVWSLHRRALARLGTVDVSRPCLLCGAAVPWSQSRCEGCKGLERPREYACAEHGRLCPPNCTYLARWRAHFDAVHRPVDVRLGTRVRRRRSPQAP